MKWFQFILYQIDSEQKRREGVTPLQWQQVVGNKNLFLWFAAYLWKEGTRSSSDKLVVRGIRWFCWVCGGVCGVEECLQQFILLQCYLMLQSAQHLLHFVTHTRHKTKRSKDRLNRLLKTPNHAYVTKSKKSKQQQQQPQTATGTQIVVVETKRT